jgi:hypothetical protein
MIAWIENYDGIVDLVNSMQESATHDASFAQLHHILKRGMSTMAEPFEYISQARLVYKDGYRNAYLGEVETPVVYGVQGKLREYYGAKEGPAIASTLDHIVAAVAG